jgi:hypothetical protein
MNSKDSIIFNCFIVLCDLKQELQKAIILKMVSAGGLLMHKNIIGMNNSKKRKDFKTKIVIDFKN